MTVQLCHTNNNKKIWQKSLGVEGVTVGATASACALEKLSYREKQKM